MKFHICAECNGSMPNVDFRMFVLKNVYRNMVGHRLHRPPSPFRTVSGKVLRPVAEKLQDTKLCKLFVEAQFHGMPQDFCLRTFKSKFPPANVCFGGKCWERYKEYVERGIRDAT